MPTRLGEVLGQGIGFSCHRVSTHGNRGEAQALHWRDRCLPYYSTSTCGFFLLLTRFALCDVGHGGLRTKPSRKLALDLLGNMLRPLADMKEPLNIDVVATDSWKCRWPRPEDPDKLHFKIVISTKGMVDFTDLLRFKAASQNSSSVVN